MVLHGLPEEVQMSPQRQRRHLLTGQCLHLCPCYHQHPLPLPPNPRSHFLSSHTIPHPRVLCLPLPLPRTPFHSCLLACLLRFSSQMTSYLEKPPLCFERVPSYPLMDVFFPRISYWAPQKLRSVFVHFHIRRT